MTIKEMIETINKLAEDCYYDYDAMGVRFEDKDRTVGEEITENSKHNEDRDDEREFPEYGTTEYEEMEELDGVSAWDVESPAISDLKRHESEEISSLPFIGEHCYFIAGDYGRNNETGDVGEVVVKNAKVIAKLF
ncbi:hypothetical protein OYT88_04490 [Sporolactobacillus sp. CQH2019]|uniref:hypothetical protein n=1 Tax=Sporolactobacillus sp. CQH2019 TaxID=3023512 RepID=UPI0023674CB0|nr:hypothetical protein [Sporolactobacillus sp. CQH2019]MDD9147808.1 hypothetical protein [Sporolactobacillus sp. CQH2019]